MYLSVVKMPIRSKRQGKRIIVNTSNHFKTYRYTAKVYEKPNGTNIIVPNDDITKMVKEELQKYGKVSDEIPEKYRFPNSMFTPSHRFQGKFTILEKVGETIDLSANIYKTDCGEMTTNTDLTIGETYETYRKNATHFGYRKVE
jgi:hypothetical protein